MKSSLERIIEMMGGETADQRAARELACDDIVGKVNGYPQQATVLKSLAENQLSAVQANRRAGKTFCIASLIEGRLINRDGYIVRVLTQLLKNPSKTWLDCGDKESFLKRLKRLGLDKFCRVERSQGSVVCIKFDWGSELHIVNIQTEAAIDGHHGVSADLWWADEAQSIPLLPLALGELVYPTLGDSDGQVILSGTPGKLLGTLFHNAATSDDSPFTQARCYSWENPKFGPTDEIRWKKIVDNTIAIDQFRYGLSDDDIDKIRGLSENERRGLSVGKYPDDETKKWFEGLDSDLRRQGFGAWVVGGAEYVFEWHRTEDKYWLRDPTSPWSECEIVAPDTIAGRVALLPKRIRFGKAQDRQWKCVLGFDLGFNPDPCAFVVVVYSPGLDHAFVIWSETQYEQPDHLTLKRLLEITRECRAAGLHFDGVIGDVNGTRKGTGASWNWRFREVFGGRDGEWIQEAQKQDMNLQIRLTNIDMMTGRWKFIEGDALDIEGRHLKWKAIDPANPKPPKMNEGRQVTLPDGRTFRPGDHAADAWRYTMPLIPILHNEPEPETQNESQWAYQQIIDKDKF